MLPTSRVSLPVSEPPALLDVTLLLVLFAQHPDRLAPSQERSALRPPRLPAPRHKAVTAHHVAVALREVT